MKAWDLPSMDSILMKDFPTETIPNKLREINPALRFERTKETPTIPASLLLPCVPANSRAQQEGGGKAGQDRESQSHLDMAPLLISEHEHQGFSWDESTCFIITIKQAGEPYKELKDNVYYLLQKVNNYDNQVSWWNIWLYSQVMEETSSTKCTFYPC